MFAVKAARFWPTEISDELQRKLISFLLLMQGEDGRFHNLMDFSHQIIDKPTVGDNTGRALWAAGAVVNSNLSDGMRASARLMFDRALPYARESTSPRTKAYACLALNERLQAEPEDDNLRKNLKLLADELVRLYENCRASDWEWFEDILTYENARLSHALFAAYESLSERAYLGVAEKTLRFLMETGTIDGTCVPIGNGGWYPRGGKRALYDQQPIEPGAMVEAAALAYKLTGSKVYEDGLRRALGWFFGLNTKSVKVYDDSTGGCYDGINPKGLNENQGAESTLAFLLAANAFIENFSQEET